LHTKSYKTEFGSPPIHVPVLPENNDPNWARTQFVKWPLMTLNYFWDRGCTTSLSTPTEGHAHI